MTGPKREEAHSKTIYTIGYGNRSMDEFIALLKQYDIEYLVDIRSVPYSKYNPAFSKTPLSAKLKQNQIGYLFMGPQLGGKPDDETCYTDGKVDYDKLREADFYQAGIVRLETALKKNYRIVLMCSELKPEMCHRSKLVGQTLDQNNFLIQHIDETGLIQNQQAVINRLTQGQLSFFEQSFTSQKKYR